MYASKTSESKHSIRRKRRWPRHDFWPSKFNLEKHHYLKLKLVREPWTFPMGALNLAATQIQRTWRGVPSAPYFALWRQKLALRMHKD